eukprot:5480351-Pleurochrysis_carterae.AAC.2
MVAMSATVVAAELDEAHAVDAAAWTAGRLDNKQTHELATLVLCNVPPAETSRCLDHGEGRRVVFSHVVAIGCGFVVVDFGCRVNVRCVNAMTVAKALRRILAADHAFSERSRDTFKLVEGLDGQRKQRDVAILAGWEMK